jgi:hypothetical protein
MAGGSSGAKNFAVIALTVVALFGVFLWYSISGSNEVRPQVEAFCVQVMVGAPVAGIEDRAKAKGLNLLTPAKIGQNERPHSTVIGAYKTYALSRAWRCDVEHADGKVLSKRLYDWSWD